MNRIDRLGAVFSAAKARHLQHGSHPEALSRAPL
jgi:hypothetical protein